MSDGTTPVLRLADLDLEPSSRGTLFASDDAYALGQKAGLRALGFGYSVVPAGKSGAPFHNHHAEDEMFVVLEGEGTYRFGAERHAFVAGDVLIAPAGGQETAHQIINTGSVPLRFLAISSKAPIEVCEYPDSGKFLLKSYDQDLRHMSRRDSHIEDYWDGEPGA